MVMALERFLAKHVEMNHHARLVLFIRSQNVITELEAEEYLNPAALGGASQLQQPNMQARHAVRAGMVAHGIAFGVLALMLGLIHVAPLSATPAYSPVREAGHGYLRIVASPWARIWIDGVLQGETPLGRPIALKEGTHTVRLEHDWYRPVDRVVEIVEGAATAPKELVVDFDAEHIPLAPGKTRPGPPASTGATAGEPAGGAAGGAR
jgi:serine/threonine-protein kinase